MIPSHQIQASVCWMCMWFCSLVCLCAHVYIYIYIISLCVDAWRSRSVTEGLRNGDASSSSLTAKGFRSVRPNLQEKKSPTPVHIYLIILQFGLLMHSCLIILLLYIFYCTSWLFRLILVMFSKMTTSFWRCLDKGSYQVFSWLLKQSNWNFSIYSI